MQPFISIITPCRNSAKTIERTIQSVLRQGFKDYEYIIVDGASTDGTVDIIKNYEPLFEGRMHWKSEPDTGIYNGFNKGCKRAKGIYTWIVNSDDWIEADALQTIHDILIKNETQEKLLVGRMNLVDEDGKKVSVTPTPTQAVINRAFERDTMVTHPATIVPKAVYERYGYYDERFRIAADMDWFHRIYARGARYICTDAILTNFALGGASTSHHYKKELHERLLFVKNKYGHSVKGLFSLLLWHYRYFRPKWLADWQTRRGLRKMNGEIQRHNQQ